MAKKSKLQERYRSDFMIQTNNGGRLESVAGFNVSRVLAQEFPHRPLPLKLRNDYLGDSSYLEFAVPQHAIGNDDRTPVPSSSMLPWRCICQLVIEGLNERQLLGTGWLVGPKTIITAGHNLYSHKERNWASNIYVIPGRDGNVAPFSYYQSTKFAVHDGWSNSGDITQDVGVIWLGTNVGERLGWFGIASYSDNDLAGMIVNTAGYPADKRLGTQWFTAGRIDHIEDRILRYGLDTEGGQSGSPVFEYDAENHRIAHAVHAYGGGGYNSNLGIRINNDIYDLICNWIR
nr:hypothetical protein FFPRI1PSEUD_31360 [Pseudomonas sp. FFPRI_1]